MPLDSRYIIASDLQQYFVDKTTGAPLTNGTITFYKDQARNESKDVFILSGSAPNYTYTNIGNEVTLSAVGTVQYMSNDVVLYYFPYDADGNIELYYVVVKDEDDVNQFTREAWPNFTADDTPGDQDLKNYIPNGQFVAHNNLPATDSLEAGEIRAADTIIAPGGWHFLRPGGSSAKDIVTFERIASDVSNPAASPRYKLTVANETIGVGDLFKDVAIQFENVNKFSSDTQTYTFAITMQNNGEGIDDVDLILSKNFGTGGSPSSDEEVPLTTFQVDTTFSIYQFNFSFGDNTDKTIGTNDDDYVQLILRLPLSSTFSISFDDAILAPGEVQIDNFPVTTDADVKARAVAGFMNTPDHNGFDLYLPLVNTLNGTMFDDSSIGNIEAESQLEEYTSSVHDSSNKLLADGAQYKVSDYSSLGIPYQRLFNKYYDTTLQIPIYGTGDNFMSAYISDLSPASQLRISTNKVGSQTDATDGSSATGFTFATIHDGADYKVNGFVFGPDGEDVYVHGTVVGLQNHLPAAGTSGFTIINYRDSASEYQLFSITTTAASGLAGKYFEFGNTTTTYYMWFTVNGSGSDPAPGGTGIQVDLLSTYTAKEVAACVREAISGFQTTTIVCNAASTLSGGEFFNIYANNVHYYVWYTVDGTGTEPIVSNAVGIQIDLLGADTATDVASKTQAAINSVYFAVPDLRGYILRGLDSAGTVDLDYIRRFSNVTSYYGGQLGTQEWDANLPHNHMHTQNHNFNPRADPEGGGSQLDYWFYDFNNASLITIHPTGGIAYTGTSNAYESRPINKAVNYAIRY